MASRFLNLDTDETLSSNSNDLVPSQKAVKTYADNKQPKTLSTPIVVDETTQTTVEGTLGAINTLASSKQDKLTTSTGINITSAGVISTDALRNTATGSEALTVLGNVSSNSQAHNIGIDSVSDTYGTAVGYTATAGTAGTAIGTRTSAGNYSVAIGSTNGASVATEATGSSAIAIGYNAKATANNAIQIGTGVNSSADTVQIKSYQLLNSSGIVPTDRLPIATSASTGIVQPDGTTITISGGVLTATPEPVMSGATSSSNGTSGLVPAPTSADYNKYLRGDGTWGAGTAGGGDYLPISGGTMIPSSGASDIEITFDTNASASIKADSDNLDIKGDGGIYLESYGSDVEITAGNETNLRATGTVRLESYGEDVSIHSYSSDVRIDADANLFMHANSKIYIDTNDSDIDINAGSGHLFMKVDDGNSDLDIVNDGQGDLNIAVRGSSANINVETTSGGAFIYNGGNVLTNKDVTSSYVSSGTNPVNGQAIASAISGKADKATTLAGYGITDAYTKTQVDGIVAAVYKPAGSVTFASLPALSSSVLGNVYNVTDAFTTTSDFVEGSGKEYPAGTNVVVVEPTSGTYKFDVLAGFVDLSDYAKTSSLATVATTGNYNDLISKPTIPSEINDLSDVSISSASGGQLLTYNSVTSKWENSNAPVISWGDISGVLSSQTDLQSALNAKQDVLSAGANIVISGGTISATDTTYTAGDNIVIGSGNVISAIVTPYSLPVATSNSLGGVKIGSGVSVTSDGTISVVSSSYTLPEATTSSLGGVIVGGGMNVASNGTISVPAMSGATSSANGTSGLVPAPTTSDSGKFLKGDGTWTDPSISGVFSTSNLVGGKGISLAEKINYSYIDADTMEVWHFDSSYTGFVNNLAINFSSDGRFDTTNYKFGTASTTTMREAYGNSGYAGNGYGAYVDTFNLTSESKLTIDFWVQLTSGTDGTYNDWAFFNFLNQNPIGIKTYWNASTRIFYVSDIATQELSQSIVCDSVGEWHHVAYTYDGSYDTNTAQSVCYIDGVPVLKQTYARTTTFNITRFNMCYQQVNYRPELHFDEVRIAKKIVFTGDFSDDLMTEEYMYPDPSVEPIYEIKNLAYPAYTTTNLIGGDGISIAEKANPQYIDARTLVLMHFNDDYYEEITGTTPEHYGSETYVTGKFGKAIQIGSGSDVFYGTFELSSTTDYTIDYWCKFTYDSSYFQLGPLRFIRNSEYELQVNQGQWTTLSTFTMTDSLNQFNHFAIQRKNQYYQVYFNGKLLGLNKYLTDTWSKGLPYSFGVTGGDPLDELRISDVARYDGDFTPLTVPYAEPDPDAEKVYEVTNLFKPDTNAYTRDNLIAGVNTSITEYVYPNLITSDVLCVFHFDEAAYNPNNMSFGYDWGYQERMDISVFDSGKSVTGNGLVMDMPNSGADFTYQKAFSADAWLAFNDNMPTSTDSGAVFGFGSNTSGYGWSTGSYFIQAQITKTQIVFSSHNSNSVTVNMPDDWLPDNTFHHVYIPYDGAGNAYLYVDGKKLATLTGVDSDNWTIKSLLVRSANQWAYAAWDEIRVSKNNPWTTDFVPPTGVYKVYDPTAPKVYQINSTSGLGKQIGEVFWSQSSSASDNAGGLPLFTGETISSADTVYPEFYQWVADHADLQISAADYNTAISTYGECPKYVIDTVNKTIRLPKLVNYIKNANTTDGITQAEAGLPNITGYIDAYKGGFGGGGSAGGAFTIGAGSYAGNVANEGGSSTRFTLNASDSNSEYGNANTVTPAHTTLFPWVCAYNTAVEASVAQAAEFQQALTGKLDIDLDNIANAGKDAIVNICMPDYANVVTVSSVTPGFYTQVAKDSFVVVQANDPFTADAYLYVSPDNGTTKYTVGWWYNDINSNTKGSSWSFFVPKGWYFTSNVENSYTAYVYPLKGAQ